MSVVHVEYPETMVRVRNAMVISTVHIDNSQDEQKQVPREKGLNDPKLGSIDKNMMCATCGESPAHCPGHFGHIELAVPVYHVGFINKIKKLLEMVCHNCGKLLVDEVGCLSQAFIIISASLTILSLRATLNFEMHCA